MDATPIRTSLAAVAAVAAERPASAAEFDRLRREAWLARGAILVLPGDALDDWIAARPSPPASMRWGRRMRK